MSVKISDDVVKKIRQIEIYTRRLLNGSLVGDNASAIKGSGFEFDQIREYHFGDDIRCIDWRGSARAHKLLVKQYIEERNRIIILAVDVSASRLFSSGDQLRCEVMAEVASVLALVGDYGKDAVGLLLFSESVELFIPPAQGRSHVRRIIEKIHTHVARGKQTNIKKALEYLNALNYRNSMLFFISDFIDQKSFEISLRLASKKYDMVAVRCLDKNESDLPSVGFLMLKDMETGGRHMVDMRGVRSEKMHTLLLQRAHEQYKMLNKYGIDCVDIKINQLFVGHLIRFFRRRMMY